MPLLLHSDLTVLILFFFLDATPPTQIYTLSLHDALPISAMRYTEARLTHLGAALLQDMDKDTVDFVLNYDERMTEPDRKSTRLNSSHTVISYAVFCLKKKTQRDQRVEHSAHCR